MACGHSRTRDGHSSRTPVARRLQQPTRTAGSGHRSRGPLRFPRAGPRAVPIRSCSRWGLPCRRRCRRRGALLPHRFTLAAANATPAAVCSLWHCPWARTRRMLSGTACPRSPDFPPRQPFGSAGAAVRPTDWIGMGMLALRVKRRGGSQRCGLAPRWSEPGLAWRAGSAAWRASTRRRRHRCVPDGNGAGTPRARHGWRNRRCR